MFEGFTVLLGILLGLLGLLYLWISRHFTYWTRRGLVQPASTVPLFGNMLDYLLNRRSFAMIMDDIYRSHPNHEAVGVYSLFTPKILLRSPGLAQKVLVSDFTSFHDNEVYILKSVEKTVADDPFFIRGEAWKPARAKLSQTMTLAKIKEIFPLMKETMGRLDSYLHEHVGEDIEAKDLVTLFMMDNVSNCVFGIISNCFTDPEAAFRKMGDLIMKDSIQSRFKTIINDILPSVKDLLGLRLVPKSVNSFIEKLVQDVMENRIKNNITRNDLFQVFMKKSMETNNTLNEMFTYGMTFFMESFETSAMTASLAVYELAMNPAIQQTLYEELRAVFGDKFDPDVDTLCNSLPYMDKVIQESQRKYPNIYSMRRICTKRSTLEIDGKSVPVDVGTTVMVPVFSLQRDPRFFPDPDKFDPERFNEEEKASRPPCTFLAFGDGPRICPGIKFALVQVKLLIAAMVYNYRIVKSSKTPEKLTFDQPVFLLMVPGEKLWIRIEKRNK